MSSIDVIAIFLSIAAVASFVNVRFVKLPATIGMMVTGLIMSLVLIALGQLGLDIRADTEHFLGSIDFGETLMTGMLSLLLFAGAIKVNINDLAEQKSAVASLATVGVIASTFIIGTGVYWLLQFLGLGLSYAYCLVFGALISPTDPVAVLSILKTVKVSKSLETRIAGESLFNDGVGIVVFIVMVSIAGGSGETTAGHIVMLFLREAVGGALFGFVAGWIAYRLIKQVDDYTVEILITLALVVGGYALASELHLSGPIAVVVAGLLIGNRGRQFGMSETTRMHLDSFWELIDEIFNAVLFVWMGLEILILPFTSGYVMAGLAAIIIALGARYLTVFSVISLLEFRRQFNRKAVLILTWGGLRGGISIALALSLAAGQARDVIVAMTYVVVIFSILVQGLTIKKLISEE